MHCAVCYYGIVENGIGHSPEGEILRGFPMPEGDETNAVKTEMPVLFSGLPKSHGWTVL